MTCLRFLGLKGLLCRHLLAALLLLLAVHAGATEQVGQTSLRSSFHHSAWRADDGAPADIWALAQTREGWLWLGGSAGLYRFDGMRFERMEEVNGHPLRSSNVLALMATPDGALWLGYRFGGISVFRAGQARDYTAQDGLPMRSVLGFDQAPDGSIWAATALGVAYLEGERWQLLGRAEGLPDDVVTRVVARNPLGVLVATRSHGIYLRPQGQATFRALAVSADALLVLPDQSVLASGPGGLFKYSEIHQQFVVLPASTHAAPGLAMLADRQGGVWIADAGVLSLRYPGAVQPATQVLVASEGLSGETVQAMLEDREGNIWLGTSGGVDRLRRTKLVSLALPPQMQRLGLTRGSNGTVWSGGFPDLLEVDANGRQQRHAGIWPSALYTDPAEIVWLGTRSGVWRIEDGHKTFIGLPLALRGREIQALSRDGRGGIWVAVDGKGLWLWKDGRWSARGGLAALPLETPLTMLLDPKGHTWFAYPGDRLARLANGQLVLLDARQGLQTGTVLSLAWQAGRLWLGGERGLAWFDGQRFHLVQGQGAERFLGVSGIVPTANGDLWLHGSAGISRIRAPDVQRLWRMPSYALPFLRLNYQDGLRGVAAQLRPLPSLVEASDGKLWYASSIALGWIDPARIRHNPLPPPLSFRRLLVDGRHYPASDDIVLPAGKHNLQIDYAALSLTIPERIRFRYRLDGVDAEWQEVGSRREAYYHALGSGDYTFRLMACNEDGVWSDVPASLRVHIPPTFIERGPVRLVAGLLLLLGLLALYCLRMRAMAARIKQRSQARLIERERIAHALHDTLLQGMQGLLLRMQSAARYSRVDGERTASIMNEVMEQADGLMAEGREQIMAVRAGIECVDGLPRALREIATLLADEHGVYFQLLIEGHPRDIPCALGNEIYALGREALFNAFRHARARKVELELVYGDQQFQLRVGDDGIGIAEAYLNAGRRPGHWGLAGMHERAEQMGASLTIWSQPDKGTEIVLGLPAGLAYLQGREPRWLRGAKWLWRKGLKLLRQ